jgi:hypothetical protein
MMFLREAVMSTSRADDELDAAVLKKRLGDGVALLAGFELRPFDGVHLEKVLQVDPIAPEGTIVIPVN